ncbi:uncharacterized protein [Clytia hemisphaerica]|uniref:SURP motif domain-containing protein n=1 Tax=Clytia hemisphaerica TaxID=252671 RepID=A0A7M5TQG9_9CNID
MSILFGPGETPFQKQRNKSKQSSGSSSSTKNYEDISVFGYQCKFFRDDETANAVNTGKTLIPWMGSKDLMIDRYDCRGHLYKLDNFDFTNNPGAKSSKLSTEELDIESILDEERYLDLNRDTAEDEILEEEAEKRSKALYDQKTAYQSISFSYDDSNADGKSISDMNKESRELFDQYCLYYGYDKKDQAVKSYFEAYQRQQQYESNRPPPPPNPPTSAPSNPSSEAASMKPATQDEGKPEPFLPPEGIEIPKEIQLPETRRMQAIIEKTASFLSKQNSQMEIVLKTKQSGNPQFGFLNYDHYLNAFYKFILAKIKDGSYTPNLEGTKDEPKKEAQKQNEPAQGDGKEEHEKQATEEVKKPPPPPPPPSKEKNESESDSDSDSEGEGELHPLLQAHRRPVTKPVPPKPKPTESTPLKEAPVKKPAARPEDMAKIYMSMKYKSNPEPELEEVGSQPPTTSERLMQPGAAGPPPPHQGNFHHQHRPPFQQGMETQPPPPGGFQHHQPFPPPPPGFNQQMGGPPPPFVGNNFRPHPQAPPHHQGMVPPMQGMMYPPPPGQGPPGMRFPPSGPPPRMEGFPPFGGGPLPPRMGIPPPPGPGSHQMQFQGFQGPPHDSMPQQGPFHQPTPMRPSMAAGGYPTRPTGPIGPQPAPRPPQSTLGPQREPPQEFSDSPEPPPPGVDSLPPPPVLPMAPSIADIDKAAVIGKPKNEESHDKPEIKRETSISSPKSDHKPDDSRRQPIAVRDEERETPRSKSEGDRYRPSSKLSSILKSTGMGIVSSSYADESPEKSPSVDSRDRSRPQSPDHVDNTSSNPLDRLSQYSDDEASRSPINDRDRDYESTDRRRYESPRRDRNDYDTTSRRSHDSLRRDQDDYSTASRRGGYDSPTNRRDYNTRPRGNGYDSSDRHRDEYDQPFRGRGYDSPQRHADYRHSPRQPSPPYRREEAHDVYRSERGGSYPPPGRNQQQYDTPRDAYQEEHREYPPRDDFRGHQHPQEGSRPQYPRDEPPTEDYRRSPPRREYRDQPPHQEYNNQGPPPPEDYRGPTGGEDYRGHLPSQHEGYREQPPRTEYLGPQHRALPPRQPPSYPAATEPPVSPFAKLSESLKFLQQKVEPAPSVPTTESPVQPNISSDPPIVEPSADLQPVIERLAQYVAKNGDEFETGIREKKDPRFDFLNNWNVYHGYYLQRKTKALEDQEVEKQKEMERKKNLKVKFGLKTTNKTGTVKTKSGSHGNMAAIFNQNDDDDDDEDEEGPGNETNTGFKPNKETETEMRARLQNQIEEKERRLKELQEKALLQQNINLANQKASQRQTPQQIAAMKRKAQTESFFPLRKDESDETPTLRSSHSANQSNVNEFDSPHNAKRKFNEKSSQLSNTVDKKQGAFHAAINQAFNTKMS